MTDYRDKTDEQLIQELREGNTEVVDYIMEKYKNMVRKKAKAMYILGGENDDLIQEGMIGLFKAVRDYNPECEATFATFADLCVARQMYSAIEASKRKKHIPLNSYVSIYETSTGEVDGNGTPLPLVDTMEAEKESNPEALILGREQIEQLKQELKDCLSNLESEVFHLQLQGNDYQAIAKMLGKSPKTIDNALQRIRTKADQIMQKIRKN